MKPVFTLLWCIKFQYDSNCVYFTSFILDVILYLWMCPYGLGHGGQDWTKYWPATVFFVASVVAVLMAIFAIIQIITKSSSAGSRHATYVQCRLYTIIGLAVGGLVLFVFSLVNSGRYSQQSDRLRWAFEWASPLIVSALALHSYHENFV